MKHIPEDIIEALYIIKETCMEQENCEECPFSVKGTDSCIINTEAPGSWKIGELPSPWKALE